jgi:hypothetical protein
MILTALSSAAQSLPQFIFATNVDVGQEPVAVAAGDFNGDGRQDMVVASQGGHELRIFLADANGRFSRADKYHLQFNPANVVVADVNGDHKLDIVVATAGPDASGGFSVLLGNGDGTFQPEIPYELPGQAFTLAVGDFNGDGAPDLAVSFGYGKGSGTAIILNKGNGTFGAPASVIPLTAKSIIVGDFNGDGKLDLICSVDVEIEFFPGNGDGTFQSGEELGPGMDNYALALAVGDLNGDGKLDFVAAGTNVDEAGMVWVYLGNGDGTFQTGVTYITDGLESVSAIIADLNGDGKLDIATANASTEDVTIFYGRGDGTFRSQINYRTASSPEPGPSVLALVGNDLVVCDGPTDVSVLAGNGKGEFLAARDYAIGETTGYLFTDNLAFGDINGDGRTDIAIPDGRGVNIFMNEGGGAFHDPYYMGLAGSGVALGDFNGDGKLDLVSGYSEIGVELGRGDGTFGHLQTYKIVGGIGSYVVGDFNGDGNLDIAAAENYYGNVYVLLGNGDGTFRGPVAYPTHQPPSTILAADLNGDGKLDLYVTGWNGGPFRGEVLLGNGDGTFQPPIFSGDPGGLTAVLADFNGDGKLDLALGQYSNAIVNVALGKGDGTFYPAQQYNAGSGACCVVAADFNGDGRVDLAVGDDNGQSVSLLYGNGDGTFQNPVSFPACQVWAMGSSDLNGDGLPDLAIIEPWGNGVGGTVAVTLNRHGKRF